MSDWVAGRTYKYDTYDFTMYVVIIETIYNRVSIGSHAKIRVLYLDSKLKNVATTHLFEINEEYHEPFSFLMSGNYVSI